MHDESRLLATRSEFPTLEKGVHLISHSLGAQPKRARAYATQFLDEWENESINAWHEWLPAVRDLGDIIGRVIGVDPGTIAMLPNVSSVQGIVASCFTFDEQNGFEGRNKIVYDDLNFSTVHYVWQEQQRRGAELCLVKSRDGIHPPMDELLDAIDERTLLVPISHVLFRSSAMYDAKRVIDRAHEKGAMVLLDCYQSAATVPLRLKEWNVRHGVRRLGEVGVRRPRRGVPLRPSRPAPEAPPDVDRLVRPRRAVRVRHGPHAVRQRRVAHDRRHDADPRGLHGARRLGDGREARRRGHPRQVTAADQAPARRRSKRAASP